MGTLIKYRFKCFLKNKMLVFWTLLFPIILATIFNFVLKDIQNITSLEKVSVALVDKGNESLVQLVNELGSITNEQVLHVEKADEKKAQQLLKEDKVSVIVYAQQEPTIQAKQHGYETTIVRSILNTYTRIYSQVENLAQHNPALLQELVIEDLLKNNATIQEVNSKGASKDVNMLYFYTIIAMICLYGMMWGVTICNDAQATQSKQAARVNVSSLPKLKMLCIDFCLCFVLIASEILIAMSYLILVLNISFSQQWGLIALIVLASSLMSLSIGILIGTLKVEFQVKIGIISALTILLNFLAGMMETTIPYIIDQYAPILSYINPANLITRSFTMMYYLESYKGVYLNIGILTLMGMVCLLISYFRIRRVSYASL